MTLNELKVECIKFTTLDENVGFNATTYNSYANSPEYKSFCNNITHSINRVFSRLTTQKKVGIGIYEILPVIEQSVNDSENPYSNYEGFSTFTLGGNGNKYYKYSIENATNLYAIKSVSYLDSNNYFHKTSYKRYGNNHIYLPEIDSGKYIVEYYKKIPLLRDSTIGTSSEIADTSINLETEYGISDELCHVVAYFAKAELFEEQEPEIAQQYRNYGEVALSLINYEDFEEELEDDKVEMKIIY